MRHPSEDPARPGTEIGGRVLVHGGDGREARLDDDGRIGGVEHDVANDDGPEPKPRSRRRKSRNSARGLTTSGRTILMYVPASRSCRWREEAVRLQRPARTAITSEITVESAAIQGS